MSKNSNSCDVLIVGAGPAGLAIADHLQREMRLDVTLLDKGNVGQAISEYPTFMKFHSTRERLELGDMPFTIVEEKPTRQQYLIYLARFAQDRKLDVRREHLVTGIERDPDLHIGEPGAFTISASTRSDEAAQYKAGFVIIANGAWDHPNKLGIPGDDAAHVTYRYTEAHPYIGRCVLVIGGGNSAIDTALELYRAGANVHLSYRRDSFGDVRGLKYWLKPDIENRLKNGEIGDHLGTVPTAFGETATTLKKVDTGEEYELPIDLVICMTGYHPDFGLLEGSGIEVDRETGKPTFDPETYESNIPGVFLGGCILQGNMSGRIFIENSREHGGPILKGIKQYRAAAQKRLREKSIESISDIVTV